MVNNITLQIDNTKHLLTINSGFKQSKKNNEIQITVKNSLSFIDKLIDFLSLKITKKCIWIKIELENESVYVKTNEVIKKLNFGSDLTKQKAIKSKTFSKKCQTYFDKQSIKAKKRLEKIKEEIKEIESILTNEYKINPQKFEDNPSIKNLLQKKRALAQESAKLEEEYMGQDELDLGSKVEKLESQITTNPKLLKKISKSFSLLLDTNLNKKEALEKFFDKFENIKKLLLKNPNNSSAEEVNLILEACLNLIKKESAITFDQINIFIKNIKDKDLLSKKPTDSELNQKRFYSVLAAIADHVNEMPSQTK